MRKVAFAVLAMATLLSACTQIECALNNKVECVWSFVYADGDTLLPRLPLTISSKRISDGNDTVIINQRAQLTTLDMPMSHGLEADTLLLTFTNEDNIVKQDWLIIGKTNQPIFESVDCGARFHHVITAAASTHNAIDTVVVVAPNVTNEKANENIRIYLKRSY